MAIGFVRMDPDGRPDVIVAFGNADDVAPFALPGRYVEKALDAVIPGVFKHFILTFDQALVIEVAMAVDHPHSAASSASSSSSSRGNSGVGCGIGAPPSPAS